MKKVKQSIFFIFLVCEECYCELTLVLILDSEEDEELENDPFFKEAMDEIKEEAPKAKSKFFSENEKKKDYFVYPTNDINNSH